jgi:hypothetical protein
VPTQPFRGIALPFTLMNVKEVYWKQMFEVTRLEASKSFSMRKENKTVKEIFLQFPLCSDLSSLDMPEVFLIEFVICQGGK